MSLAAPVSADGTPAGGDESQPVAEQPEPQAVPKTRPELKAALERCGSNRTAADRVVRAVLARGPSGVALLLDVFCPEGMAGADEATVRALLRDLDADDGATCKRAVLRLYELGPALRGPLEEALPEAGTMLRIRIRGIIATWDAEQVREADRYAGILRDELRSVTDAASLDLMAERVGTVLARGAPDGNGRSMLMGMMAGLARSRDDRYSKLLAPLLEHDDVQVAVLAVNGLGAGRPNRYMPPIVLEALAARRPEVVEAAISWTPNCWDAERKGEVGRLLRHIFRGDDEPLKFNASFALMHSWGDAEAEAYILSQTQSPDAARTKRAISWIGDSCNSGQAEYPELLRRLVPYLNSDETDLRRMAADALGTYSGEQVVRALAFLLDDKVPIIATEARRNLLEQRDKALVRRVLQDTLETMQGDALRAKVRDVLGQLENDREKRGRDQIFTP